LIAKVWYRSITRTKAELPLFHLSSKTKRYMPKFQIEKLAQLTGHNASIFALSKDQNPRHYLSGAGDGWIVRWDLDEPENGRLVAKIDTQVFSLLYLPKWDKAVIGDMNGGVHWVPLQAPDDTKDIAHHQKGVFAITQIGDHIYTAGGQGMLTRWSAEESRSLDSLQLSRQSLRCLAYAPKRNELAVGSSDNSIYLLDADSLTLKHHLPDAHNNSVFSLHYTPDESYLLSGGRDALLKAWQLDKGEPQAISSQPAHWYTINSIAFHPSGKWFATGSRDKTIKIWDADNFQLLKVLDTVRSGCHVNSVNRLLWHDYHNYLISASDDRSMIVWDFTEDFI
jgi:WD40 repeat protein